jgi:hypothetical protein
MGRHTHGKVAWLGLAAVFASFMVGCETPSPHTIGRNSKMRSDLPVDPPGVDAEYDADCATGGRLFQLYCGSCHNARPLGERPFSNYQVAIAHMRDQAYLTGKEYRQIIRFLRRWDDVGPPTRPVEASPKRFIYSQPISELRGDSNDAGSAAPPPPPGPGPWRQPNPSVHPPTRQPASALPAAID